MFVHTITAPVPESVIRQICDEVRDGFKLGLTDPEMKLSELQVIQLRRTMDVVLDNVCRDNRVSVDGWNLSDVQVLEITSLMTQGQKINAIKAFRAATDAGLKEAKNFIDQFCTFQPHKNACPLAAMKFQMAFGK